MLSAICFNLDQSKVWSSSNGLSMYGMDVNDEIFQWHFWFLCKTHVILRNSSQAYVI